SRPAAPPGSRRARRYRSPWPSTSRASPSSPATATSFASPWTAPPSRAGRRASRSGPSPPRRPDRPRHAVRPALRSSVGAPEEHLGAVAAGLHGEGLLVGGAERVTGLELLLGQRHRPRRHEEVAVRGRRHLD